MIKLIVLWFIAHLLLKRLIDCFPNINYYHCNFGLLDFIGWAATTDFCTRCWLQHFPPIFVQRSQYYGSKQITIVLICDNSKHVNQGHEHLSYSLRKNVGFCVGRLPWRSCHEMCMPVTGRLFP
jgi:hypothetical protein